MWWFIGGLTVETVILVAILVLGLRWRKLAHDCLEQLAKAIETLMALNKENEKLKNENTILQQALLKVQVDYGGKIFDFINHKPKKK